MTPSEWIDIIKAVGVALGSGAVGAVGYKVVMGRARSQVADSAADVGEAKVREAESQAHDAMLKLSALREAQTYADLQTAIREIAALRTEYAADRARLEASEAARVAALAEVGQLRISVRRMAGRLRVAGGALTATDMFPEHRVEERKPYADAEIGVDPLKFAFPKEK